MGICLEVQLEIEQGILKISVVWGGGSISEVLSALETGHGESKITGYF